MVCGLNTWSRGLNLRKSFKSKDVRVGKVVDTGQQVVRRSTRVFVLIVALMLTTHGTEGRPSTAQDPEVPATFRASAEAVSVSVSVRDDRGRVVQDLTQAEFEVFDSGERRSIDDFWVGDAPTSLGIVLDISGSMAVGGNIHRARSAIEITLGNLRYGDEAALFTFDSVLEVVVPFTTQLDRLRAVNLDGTPYGMTSLYDAIAETAGLAAERASRHRALLVITDGVDVGSILTAPEVSGIASSIDVPVYVLTVVGPGEYPRQVAAGAGNSGHASLADLARWTGGDMQVVSAPADTLEVIQDLLTELRHQYVISFEPGGRPGWHPLEIRTSRRNLVVRARGGYVSGPARAGTE